jgi:hypothetical protein
MLNIFFKKIGLKGRQIISLLGAPHVSFRPCIALCSLVEVDRHFIGAFCHHHSLIMETVCTSEMSLSLSETVWHYILEGYHRLTFLISSFFILLLSFFLPFSAFSIPHIHHCFHELEVKRWDTIENIYSVNTLSWFAGSPRKFWLDLFWTVSQSWHKIFLWIWEFHGKVSHEAVFTKYC